MTKLKICGLRETDHVQAAVAAGADFLGFNFVPGVRRQLALDRARELIQQYRQHVQPEGPQVVGLFANQSLDDVNDTVRHCGLDMAQLCGDEPPEYWQQVEVPVIKQVKVHDTGHHDAVVSEVLRSVEAVVSHGCVAHLDKHREGSLGGTGQTFDWSIAAEVAERYEFLLAGGLTPENVGQAMSVAGPWGVDVSSGIETEGVKDSAKIARFAEEVHRADGRP
jgi:phosphoribosylanthranilate isomerase